MERIEKICKHPLYVENQKRIDEIEENRIFCCHSVNHALDVARIFYIMVLEKGLSYDKEMIYAASLLHDIGRGMQYEKKVSHHVAGAKLAEEILADCAFSVEEISVICEAIAKHHTESGGGESLEFQGLLYRADKMSRNCFDCKAGKECYWEQEKRNMKIEY